MTPHECTTDLVARQRRAQLSSAERLALDAHLSGCSSCRTARELLSDFAQEDAVEPQDGARIERLAALARARFAPETAAQPWRRKATIRALLPAAAILLLLGSAAASTWWRARSSTKSAPTAAVLASAKGLLAVTAMTPTLAATVEASSTAVTPFTEARAPSPSASESTTHAHSTVSAAALLREAGDAQRRSERDQAGQLYQRLQAQYPTSPEALLSHVSLGRLLAEGGRSRGALAEFDRYLAGSRGGVLIPEALYGRARALTNLGDRTEEARTWQRLLHDFPNSAYAEPARRRLAELE